MSRQLDEARRFTFTASVTVAVTVQVEGAWSGDATIDQAYRQATRSAKEQIESRLQGYGRVVSVQAGRAPVMLHPEGDR